jgi:hypothetical protein
MVSTINRALRENKRDNSLPAKGTVVSGDLLPWHVEKKLNISCHPTYPLMAV